MVAVFITLPHCKRFGFILLFLFTTNESLLGTVI